MSTTKDNINTINVIVNEAEQQIEQLTGIRLRLLVMPRIAFAGSPDMVAIVRVISAALDMLPSDCTVRLKEPKYVHLRVLITHFVLQYYPDTSLKGVGDIMGGYDHTTIINHKRMFKELTEGEDHEFMGKYEVALQAVTQWMAEYENTAHNG